MEDTIIEDSENFRGGDKAFGFREIVMRLLQKVITNNSQEMRKGFWIYSNPGPHVSPEKIKYVGDSRKELIRSIDCLHDVLMPKFDAEMKKASVELYREYEEWHDTWKDRKVSDEVIEDYYKVTLKIYRKLFQALCFFMERLGWLEDTILED